MRLAEGPAKKLRSLHLQIVNKEKKYQENNLQIQFCARKIEHLCCRDLQEIEPSFSDPVKENTSAESNMSSLHPPCF